MRKPVPFIMCMILSLCFAAAPVSGADNPVIAEMKLLNNLVREAVTAIALGEGERITAALAPLDRVQDTALEAVKAGKVKLMRNADRVDDFIRRDQSKHAALEALSRAAQRNDREAMLMLTKQLIESCVSCHRIFWK